TPFLRENRVVRERRGEPADDQLLGALVPFRHEVGRLALDRGAMWRATLRVKEPAGGARRVDRHAAFERRRHQSRRSLGTSSAVATPTAMSARPFTPSAALTPTSDARAPTWNWPSGAIPIDTTHAPPARPRSPLGTASWINVCASTSVTAPSAWAQTRISKTTVKLGANPSATSDAPKPIITERKSGP